MSLSGESPSAGAQRREAARANGRAWMVLLTAIALAAAAYIGVHQWAGDRVPLGTTVAGVAIGGDTPLQAQAKLAEQLGPRLARPITFTHDGSSYRFLPAASGVGIDYPATVARAGATSRDRWTPGGLWHFLTSGRAVTPDVTFTEPTFGQALHQLTGRIGTTVVEGGIDFTGGVAHPVYGRPGLAVDQQAVEALVARLLFADHSGEIPLMRRQPYVDAAAVRAAMKSFGLPAMSAPVRVRIGTVWITATPQLYGKALRMVPSGGRLVPSLDGKQLVAALAPAMRAIGAMPHDATVRLVGGSPRVVPAVYGAAYDADALAQQLLVAMVRTGSARVVRLHAVISVPQVSTAQARSWRITRRAGTAIAVGGAPATGLDGTLLRPGRSLTVSTLLASGSAQERRAVASALFTAALRAGATIGTYRPPASYDPSLPVGRQLSDLTISPPPGRGLLISTTSLGTKDLQITVWSAPPGRVTLTLSPRMMPVAPTTVDQTETGATPCADRAGRAGFTIVLTRTMLGGRQRFVSTYAPVDGIRCVTQTPSPSPSSSASP